MMRAFRLALVAMSLSVVAVQAQAPGQPAPQTPADTAPPAAQAQPAAPSQPVAPTQQAAPAQQATPAQPGTPTNPLPPALPQLGINPPSTAHPPLTPANPATPVVAPPAAAATLPHDLSPWGMFMAADIVVKGVMLGLAFASLVTWTIWLAKAMELAAAKRSAGRALRRIEAADNLSTAAGAAAGKNGKLRGAVGQLLSAALAETRRSADLGEDGI